jgi:hypothetical protein
LLSKPFSAANKALKSDQAVGPRRRSPHITTQTYVSLFSSDYDYNCGEREANRAAKSNQKPNKAENDEETVERPDTPLGPSQLHFSFLAAFFSVFFSPHLLLHFSARALPQAQHESHS